MNSSDELFLQNLPDLSENNDIPACFDLIESNVKHCNKNFFNPFKYDKIELLGRPTKTIEDIDSIESFILIIDFPFCGGGSGHFLNSIIEKYKYNQPFLILRNIDNEIHLFLNNEYKLTTQLSEPAAIDFLKHNTHKFQKIFVNHTLGHSEHFINSLFTLDKEVTTITHDHYMLFTNPNPSIEEIKNKINIRENSFINKFNRIITQNKGNLNIFNEYLNNNQEIVVTNLPDYQKSLNRYENDSSDKIVIAVIGDVSHIKGYDFVNNLFNYINANGLNMEIIVIGNIYHCSVKNRSYKSISEFNEILIEYKPHLILEASLCQETYSYTASLAMLTQLPIVSYYLDYKYAIINRLTEYGKLYCFHTMEECLNLINIHKQPYFYTVEPEIYFNSFWDNYFLTGNKKISLNKNIVMMTSKIIVSDKPFSYINYRSSYTTEERFAQTLESIKSTRQSIPNSFIVLFDNSVFDDDKKRILTENVDKFINVTDDVDLNYYTNDCECKAFADIYQQIKCFDYFLKYIDFSSIGTFFKLSGRYLINEHFNYSSYENNNIIMKKNHLVTDRDYYFTCFYKMDKTNLLNYFNELKYIIRNNTKYVTQDCEVIIGSLLKQHDNFKLTDHLGITQSISIRSVEYINERNENNI
uniref:Glycosyl transferase family 1 domain-containing protein n=1 Tax=viral metagenome TaxID=1070528 RepID=A0A6C0LJ73_9ZZZZ